ncbi:hypothetical protein ACIA8I_08325 [Streptomyces rishiriensis]|uniref:hypothetical protein n=1 Tax=Streptomyces rishiriensis TaxID=68264 RepID=UPI003790BC32
MGWKITVCAGVAVVAAVLTPTAYAASGDVGRDEGGRGAGAGVSVTPSRPSPGSEVTLRATGCDGRTATAASAAFVADAQLVVADGAGGALTGDTRVRSSLAAGGYDVRITCAGVQVKSRIKVLDPASAPPDAPSPPANATATAPSAVTAPFALTASGDRTAPASPASPYAASPVTPATPATSATSATPVAPASPVAPVRAGGGGAAPLASVEEARVDAHGPGTVQAVVGLVLVGVAAAVFVWRGRRRRRGTD